MCACMFANTMSIHAAIIAACLFSVMVVCVFNTYVWYYLCMALISLLICLTTRIYIIIFNAVGVVTNFNIYAVATNTI